MNTALTHIRRLLGLAILVPLLSRAGGTYTVTNTDVRIVVPPVVSSVDSLVVWGATNGWSDTNITSGLIANIGGLPYVAQYGGTSAPPVRASTTNVVTTLTYLGSRLTGTNYTTNVVANVLQNMPRTGAASFTDGSVVWLRCPSARGGYAIQWADGGTAVLSINGGRFDLSQTGIQAMSLSGNPAGAVTVTASGDVTVNVVEW
jgi:hypothetical protein